MQYIDLLESDADIMPVMFLDRGAVAMTDANVIRAYIYDTTGLDLEAAARIANARDADEATNLLASSIDIEGAVISNL
jgi:hypothetical protein